MLPAARILHLHRDLPQTPEDHPEFWAIWRAAILEMLPEPATHAFASETYVFRLAEELGVVPVLITKPQNGGSPLSKADGTRAAFA